MPRSNSSQHLLTWGLAVLFVGFGFVAGCSSDETEESNADTNQVEDDAGGIEADADTATSPDASLGEEEDARRPEQNGGQEWEWEDEDFEIVAVSPGHGPVDGGTQVFVHGSDLTDGTELLFGEHPVDAELSQGQLVAQTPPATSPGPVTVRAIASDGEVSEIPNGFTYADPIEIDSIVPDQLPTDGGVELTLRGAGFTASMGVSFSGQPARRIDVIDDQTARVIAPPMHRGHADLRVTIPDDHLLMEDAVYFFDRIDVDTVEPAVGSVAGGDAVTISGQGLTPDTEVLFGDHAAEVQSVNVGAATMQLITPPANTTGTVDLRLENEFDTHRIADGFTYDDGADDALYSIQPSTALVEGGSEHVVSGRNLDASDAEIYVGGDIAAVVEADESSVRIEAPGAGEPGAVDVVLQRDGTEVDRLEDALEYITAFSVDDVEPSTGDAEGGETVRLYGQGLTDVDGVFFGGLPAGFQVIDDGEMAVTTPPSEPGTVDITVTIGERQFVVDDGFTFEAPLEIWSMLPTRGALAGNTYVTVQGRGFAGTIEITVGDRPGADIRRLDPYTVAFRTPASSSTGPHEVTVEAMEASAKPPQPFIYFNPLSSFGGAHGPPIEGAVNVSVVNMDGTPIHGAFVMLSTDPDTPFRGWTDEQGQITLSGPDVIGPQTITATAADRSTFTVRELNAENLTVVLNPLEPPDNGDGEITPPPLAHFHGEITITGKGTDPEGGARYNMSKVRVTRTAVGGFQLSPGENSVVDGEGHYEVRSRVGDLALVGVCGWYDAEQDSFTPKMMAVERNLSVSDGMREKVDLECNIPLDDHLPVKLTDPVFAPDGPTINEVTPYVDFGYEGVFRMPEPVTGYDDILHAGPLPSAEGELHDITYAAVAGSYTGQGLPYTQTTLRGVTELERLESTRPLVGVPELFDPVQGGTIGDEIRYGRKGLNAPDFFYLVLRNSIGFPVWSFVVPGGDDYIPMPEFPSFDGVDSDARPTPYQPGTLYAVAYGIRIDGFDYNAFTYGDFRSGRWSAFAVDSWVLHLTD